MSVRKTLTGLAWVSPWLIGGIAFTLLPMAMSLYYSFTDYSLLEPPMWVGTKNYTRMLDDPRFLLSVKNTVIFAVVFIPLATVVSLVLAALLAGKLRFSRFFQAAVFIPTLVPLVASAMVWSWLFNGEYGLVNQALGWFGIAGPNWLIDKNWGMAALVLMSLWSIGQGVVVYIAALQDVPEQLYEAARLDGMGPGRRFFHVTVPMVSPVILFNIIVLTINTIQIFAQPYIMFRTKDGQNDAGLFYTMHLYDNAFVYQQMGYASAMAWLQLVVVLLLTAVMFVASKKLVHYRAA